MSEAELHVIKARLRGGILNKAGAASFAAPCQPGWSMTIPAMWCSIRTCRSGRRSSISSRRFLASAPPPRPSRPFAREGLLFPSRLHNSETVFRPLTASTARARAEQSALRRRLCLWPATVIGAPSMARRPCARAINDDWLACIPDAHPGYISWEQHQENLKILKANSHGYDAARASIPREGPALLQGRAVCGQCGRHFRVRYAARRGRQEAWYVCDRAHTYRGEPHVPVDRRACGR